MITNEDLAARARAEADRHPGGSLARKAWACVGVALSTTRTTAAARKVLGAGLGADLAAELQSAALEALEQLTAPPAGRHGRQQPDHRFCAVLDVARTRAESGDDEWGKLQVLPVADEAAARSAVAGLNEARDHTARKRGACGSRPLSIEAGYQRGDDGAWSVRLRVFPAAAPAETPF